MARIEKYLAAGSRVVVRSRVNGKMVTQWYQTKRDVTVPATLTDAPDPMDPANTDPVKYAVVSGVQTFFPAKIVRTRVVLEDGDVDPAALNTQYGVFHYDVHGEKFPNPSNLLYPIAVRMSESCWIMRAGDVPWNLVARMIDAGCTVDFDRFDVAESKKHVTRAVERLMEYGEERIAAAAESRRTAEAQLEGAAEEGLTEKAARDRFEGRIKSIEKQLADAEKNINAAMKVFGVKAVGFVNPSRLLTVAQQSRSSMAERALAYNHAAALLAASTDSNAQALAAAAQNSLVPAGPMADMLQEIGQEAAGVALANTFAEGNEFSLVDGTD